MDVVAGDGGGGGGRPARRRETRGAAAPASGDSQVRLSTPAAAARRLPAPRA